MKCYYNGTEGGAAEGIYHHRSRVLVELVFFDASWVCAQAPHDVSPGLCLRQASNFSPLRGFAPLTVRVVYSLFLPLFLYLLFSYCRHVLLTVRLILVRLTYCTRPLFPLSRNTSYNSKHDSY